MPWSRPIAPYRTAVGACVAFGLAATLSASGARAQAADGARLGADLEPVVRRMLAEGRIPSATIALVAGDSIVWAGAFGEANLWARSPARLETVYLIGSTFKAMSAVALLQQMERGRFRLDDPVRAHMGELRIRGERADSPITFRHLLTHTSGLPVSFGGHPLWGETMPPPLMTYLRDSLAVRGPPLDSVRYSNIAFSLIGQLVENVSGVPYRTYIQDSIWNRLDMRSTAFAPTPDMEQRLATPYVYDDTTGRHVPTPRLRANVWPAGLVYGTVLDQANWLIANLNGGAFRGRRIIGEATLREMMRLQHPRFAGPSADFGGAETGYGLVWRVATRRGERLFAHSGSVPGYTALIVGNLDRRLGVAILTNGHRSHPHLYRFADDALQILAGHVARAAS
jgi:CubicO group peptidase (beta-lactamase class C family)